MINSIENISENTDSFTTTTRQAPAITALVDTPASAPSTAPSCPSATIRWKGRDYRMFKKQPRAAATWYYEWYEGPARQRQNLQTSDRVTAEATLKLFLEGQSKGLLAQMRAVLDGAGVVAGAAAPADKVRIEDYLKALLSTPTGNNQAQSRELYVGSLRRVIKQSASGAVYLHELPDAFKAFRAHYNRRLEAELSQAKQASMKRTHNSMLQLSASCFGDKTAATLREQFKLPDLAPLHKAIRLLYFNKVQMTVSQYRPPAQSILDATVEEWQKLPRNQFIAVGIALCSGLRRNEIYAGHWSWFSSADGYVVLDAEGKFKNNSGMLYLRVINPFYSILMDRCRRQGWYNPKEPFLIDFQITLDRITSLWMKRLGWRTRKHLHALRAWSGSLVYARYGADPAKNFCRHATVQTTQKHYAWLRDGWAETGSTILVAGKPVEWAKV